MLPAPLRAKTEDNRRNLSKRDADAEVSERGEREMVGEGGGRGLVSSAVLLFTPNVMETRSWRTRGESQKKKGTYIQYSCA